MSPKRPRWSCGISGFSPRALICWTAQVLPSGSAKPKNVPPSPGEDLDRVALDAALDELGAGGRGVGDHQLQALERARRHRLLRRQVAEDDRAAGAGRRELGDVHVLVLGVVVEVEADLVAVERDRPVDVGDREDDDLEGPVHGRPQLAFTEDEQRLELVVARRHALLHAAGDHAVARLEGRVDGVPVEPGASVAEVDERHRLDGHDVGHALELEGLDRELVLAHGVEHAVEARTRRRPRRGGRSASGRR